VTGPVVKLLPTTRTPTHFRRQKWGLKRGAATKATILLVDAVDGASCTGEERRELEKGQSGPLVCTREVHTLELGGQPLTRAKGGFKGPLLYIARNHKRPSFYRSKEGGREEFS